MTLWVYVQEPIKWPFERMLKDPKNDHLSVCSRTQKITLWAYAQSLCERTLNHCLSVRSRTQKMTLWAYAQGPKKWPYECMLNDPKIDSLSIRSMAQKMALWAYAQGPKKWPFERTLKDPKNDTLSVRSRTHFRCTFSHELVTLIREKQLLNFTWVTYLRTRFLIIAWYFKSLSRAWFSFLWK